LMLADDPEGSVHELFCREFWRSHPLGWPICGTVDSIDQLSRQTLLEHIRNHYRGDNLLLCAAGCLNHQEVVDQVAAAFASLPKESSKNGLSTPQPTSGMQVNDRDLEQVHLCLGTPAPSQRHPQRFAAFVLNTLLGGSVSSRLFQKIREELGLAYSIYSYLNCYSDAGGLVVYSATGYQQLARVLGLILGEMRRLTREVATAQELQSAKEHLKGRLLLSLENTETRMMRLAKNEFYLGYQPEVADIVAAIDGIEGEEVRQLADSLFQDELLHLQLVGRNRHIDFPRNGLAFS
ncbi:MAG: pitrilysin family protein, partial [Desulfuromonadaceae bacterium]